MWSIETGAEVAVWKGHPGELAGQGGHAGREKAAALVQLPAAAGKGCRCGSSRARPGWGFKEEAVSRLAGSGTTTDVA